MSRTRPERGFVFRALGADMRPKSFALFQTIAILAGSVVALCALAFLTGCAGTRERVGFYYGAKAFENAKKNGDTVARGFGFGYVKGFAFADSMFELEQSTKKLKAMLEKAEKDNEARRAKSKPTTDDEIDRELKKAVDEQERARKSGDIMPVPKYDPENETDGLIHLPLKTTPNIVVPEPK